MADFKTALESYSKGALKIEVLFQSLDKVLSKKPKLLEQIVAQLTDAYSNSLIDAPSFAKLKARAQQAAGRTDVGEATVYAGDATEAPGHDDATQVLTEAEKSRISAEIRAEVTATGITSDSTAGIDLDLSGPSQPSTGSSWPTSGTGGTGWSEPVPQQADGQPIGPGSVLKERFILDEVLGVGGMGTVYRGRDLIKVEAKDRNPFVALKVLNEDFKKHPDSFIALQREASRQQKLAHPNIATVYDFDRTGTGGNVFLTMELMEGQPLNTFIKKVVKPKGGLPFAEAFPMVYGLGQALVYAHERQIVHSDFKPGNCFLLKTGQVKVLDFGIARAVKNPGAQQGEGEKTLFDPGKLGALTPAYASAEMLDGLDPLPPDDLYALGCVAYELLTGRHPFNKLPHNQARDNKLVPAPIKGLKRKQMKALLKALAYKREDRYARVSDFLTDFEGKTSPFKNPFVVGGAVILIVVAIGIAPLSNYMHRRKIDQMITQINSHDPRVIKSKLTELPAMEYDDKKRVLDEARDSIFGYFQSAIKTKFDVSAGKYDYPAAKELLDEAGTLYPDSKTYADLQESVEDNKNQFLSKLNDRYNQYLNTGKLLPATDGNDIASVLKLVRQIDPHHPLLSDSRLISAYAEQADKALSDNNIDRAKALVKAGLDLAPKEPALVNTEGKVKIAIEKQQAMADAAAVEKQLEDKVASATSLADVKALQPDVLKLAAINPDSAALSAAAGKIQPILENELTSLGKSNDYKQADAFRNDYSPLLSALKLQSVNQELSKVLSQSLSHLSDADQQAVAEAQKKAIDEGKGKITELLASPKLDREWETSVQSALADLQTRVPSDDAWVKATRESIAKLYTQKAETARQDQRFAEANAFLDNADRVVPGTDAVSQERQQVAMAEDAFKKAEQEKVRQAEIEGLKQTFLTQAAAKDVPSATKTLDTLKTDLSADDPFLTKQAPSALGDAYLKLALAKVADDVKIKDYSAALKFAKAGLEYQPDSQALKKAVRDYTVDGNSSELRKLFASGEPLDIDKVRGEFKEIQEIDLQKYANLEKELVSTALKRADKLKDGDPDVAKKYFDSLKELFPNNDAIGKLEVVPKVSPETQAAISALGDTLTAGNLSKANTDIKKLLGLPADAKNEDIQAAIEKNPSKDELEQLLNQMGDKRKQAEVAYDAFRSAFKARKFKDADVQLAKAETAWKDSSTLAKARAELDRFLKAPAPAKPGEEGKAGPAAPVLGPAPASAHPCTVKLAGYGIRKIASCYEMVADRARGPIMVVIPSGGKFSNPFAIGKYEVTVGDYNVYCKLSGQCAGVTGKDSNVPVTGISVADAQAYAKWLSERSGRVYRLPTIDEWTYAAEAGGKPAKKDYNCRVVQGDQVLKGQSVMAANSGSPNGWGLYNYIGNVQEWVTKGSGVVAMGGSYADNFGTCEISLEKPSDGKPDQYTGFRLIEEIGH